MSKDDFQLILIKQYSEVIEEVILESESLYKAQLNLVELDNKVKGIIKAAKVDGLPEEIVWDIISKKSPIYYDFAMQVSYPTKIAA